MSQLLFETPERHHQESSPSTAEFGCIWVLKCGLGRRGRVGRGGLVVEGRGRWPFRCHSGLVSGEVQGTHLTARWVLYPLLVCQVALVLFGGPSALDSVCWDVFVGQFRPRGWFILGVPRWVVAMGKWAVSWVFRWFRERFHGWLVVFRGLHM